MTTPEDIVEFANEHEIGSLMDDIKRRVHIFATHNNMLREENAHLKSEHYKDKELQAMKLHHDEMQMDYNRGFPISQQEQLSIDLWKKKHIDEVHNGDGHAGAIGGKFTYIFVPTSIGTSGTVRCSCGAEFEFQEIG